MNNGGDPYATSSMGSGELSPVQVCVRVRPPPEGEDILSEVKWRISSNSLIAIRDDFSGTEFTFDHVFDPKSDTETVYHRMCSPVCNRAFNGINCTVFAYGQTNSGKTYTICGEPGAPGMIQYAAEHMFQLVDSHNCPSDQTKPVYSIKVSYMELYNEQLSDLLWLATHARKGRNNAPQLHLHDDFANGGEGVVVDNLTEYEVEHAEEVVEFQRKGEAKRHIDRNNAHQYASRSHTVFRLKVEKEDFFGGSAKGRTVSSLFIVDLAGSETTYVPFKLRPGDVYDPFDKDSVSPSPRLQKRKTEYRKATAEGNNIRKSLLALVRVVRALVECNSPSRLGEQVHVPYRDSKLTRLLSNAVGGDSSTVIVCTVNPSEFRETIATLHFAADAQKINNRPKLVALQPDKPDVKIYKDEILRLREELKHVKEELANAQKDQNNRDVRREHANQKRDATLAKQNQELLVAQAEWTNQQDCMQEQINRYEEELSTLQGQVNQRDSERDEIQLSLSDHQSQLNAKEAELEEAREETRAAQDQLDLLRFEVEKHEQKCRDIQAEAEQDQKHSVAEKTEQARKLQSLSQQINERNMELDQYKADNLQLHNRVLEQSNDIETLQRERNAMERYINYTQKNNRKCGCLRKQPEHVPGHAPWAKFISPVVPPSGGHATIPQRQGGGGRAVPPGANHLGVPQNQSATTSHNSNSNHSHQVNSSGSSNTSHNVALLHHPSHSNNNYSSSSQRSRSSQSSSSRSRSTTPTHSNRVAHYGGPGPQIYAAPRPDSVPPLPIPPPPHPAYRGPQVADPYYTSGSELLSSAVSGSDPALSERWNNPQHVSSYYV